MSLHQRFKSAGSGTGFGIWFGKQEESSLLLTLKMHSVLLLIFNQNNHSLTSLLYSTVFAQLLYFSVLLYLMSPMFVAFIFSFNSSYNFFFLIFLLLSYFFFVFSPFLFSPSLSFFSFSLFSYLIFLFFSLPSL